MNFLLCQAILALIARLWGKEKTAFCFSVLFPNRILYAATVFFALLLAWLFNAEYQIFCRPVAWVYCLMLPSWTILVLFPWLPDGTTARVWKGVFWGWMGFVHLYLILFAGVTCLAGTLALGLICTLFFVAWRKYAPMPVFGAAPVVFFLPAFCFFFPYFVAVAGGMYLKQTGHRNARAACVITFFALTAVGFFFTLKLKALAEHFGNNANGAMQQYSTSFPNRYYLELLLGEDIRYHSREMIGIDGWRAPLHDPVLGFARLFWKEPLRSPAHGVNYYEAKKQWYQTAFPGHLVAPDCRCAKNERLLGL